MKTNTEISAELLKSCIEDVLPEIEQRFKMLGHRKIRVSLFVESMDPLAPPTTDSPVAMVCLYESKVD